MFLRKPRLGMQKLFLALVYGATSFVCSLDSCSQVKRQLFSLSQCGEFVPYCKGSDTSASASGIADLGTSGVLLNTDQRQPLGQDTG